MKKGVYLPQDRGADVACGQADVARGTRARMRRGTMAMWQGRAWTTRRSGGVDTWQEATRVHADAREGHHVAEWELACEGPCLEYWGGNAIVLNRPPI